MSDNEASRRQHEVMQRELAEAEANKFQLQLDRWWQAQRDEAAEYRRLSVN